MSDLHNIKEHVPKTNIFRTIYDFAYMTYADLPRGAVNESHTFSSSLYFCYLKKFKLMQRLIFPDKEQFYEEVSGYNSDGNLARRDAKHGEYDFGFLLPMNSKKNNFR